MRGGSGSAPILLLILSMGRLGTIRSSRPHEVEALAPTDTELLERATHRHHKAVPEVPVLGREDEDAVPEDLHRRIINESAPGNIENTHNREQNHDASAQLADVVGYRWKKGSYLGDGDFSQVYEAMSSGGEISHPIVLKVERPNVKERELDKEASVLRRLQGQPGVPKFHQYMDNEGMPNHQRSLAMEKLGIDLEAYRGQCGGQLSEPVVLRLAMQMIDRFRHVHHHKFVHRDVKPENFMLGWSHEEQRPTDTLYLIDFGRAGTYWDNTWKTHVPQLGPNGRHQKFVGTMRYAAAGALSRQQQSRKDDMEALAYVLGHLRTGALPWAGPEDSDSFSGPSKEAEEQKALDKEVQLRLKAEAAGWRYTKDVEVDNVTKHAGEAMFPDVIRDYLNSVRQLRYDEKPAYSEYKNMIAESANRSGIDLNAGFVHKSPATKADALQC